MTDTVIRLYYDWFNERKFMDAAALFADDATFEAPFGQPEPGRTGYLHFTSAWTQAFPTAKFTIDRIDDPTAAMREVYLFASGTHHDTLHLGPYHFKPTGADAVLHVRELLEFRHDRIVGSTVTVALNDLTSQLVRVNYHDLAQRLERIGRLNAALTDALGDMGRERTIASQLGVEIDAARRALRPYFTK